MREWRDKLSSLMQLLQSTYVRFVDALTATRAMLFARQLQSSSAGDLRIADVIRIETLDSLLLEVSSMYTTDLAAKLDLVTTLSSLVSADSSAAASPFALPPPFPPEGKDRELLVRMLGHWMYAPAVRQAQVNEVREVAKVLGARVLAVSRSR
ncbi:hypothetical protein BCR44DRAFT_191813 [Catenaria anguillulae PL171]|uniref:Uncharacterized protein n=1 Tax=Catenaria anguillulae PL171 TaxID=765915 RepID=A0A1Y2HFU5_9FUNG|nr:hypothetical protein BCR44DRAFT_191813 [Catenaria anguillulae PL171]